MKRPLQLAGLARLRPRLVRGRARLGRDVLAALQPRRAASRTSPTCARTLAWILPLQARDLPRASASTAACGASRASLDLQRIVLAAGLGALLIPLVLVMLQLQAVVPRSVLIFYPIVLIFLMAGNRFAYRIWKEHRLYSPLAALGEPVLVVGAGEAGARLTKELARSRQWRVVGLLDDDPAQARPAAAQRRACWGRSPTLPQWARALRRAQGDHRAAVGRRTACAGASPRSAPRAGARSADRAVVRGPDQRPLGADHDPQRRARRPARPRPGGARQRRAGRVARQPRRAWSPAPAARSAPSCAGRSRASGRRGWCCSTSPRRRSTRSRPRSPTRSRSCRWSTRRRRRQARGAGRRRARARAARASSSTPRAYKHVPLMEETNAWQAVRNNAYGTWVLARAAVAAQGREVRAGLHRQGGQPDQRDGRDQAPRRDRLPEPAGRRPRSSCSCASATCSAAPAA